MAFVQFINEKRLKEDSYINENVDMKILLPTIRLVQDKYIHQILGTALYKLIETQISGETLTPDNAKLLDTYIRPVIIWYVLCEASDVNVYKFDNKSIVVKRSDNSESINSTELIRYMEKFKNNAEFYAQKLTNFLRANVPLYPKYLDQSGEGYDRIIPKRDNYTGGWVFGGYGKKKRSFEERYQGKNGDC